MIRINTYLHRMDELIKSKIKEAGEGFTARQKIRQAKRERRAKYNEDAKEHMRMKRFLAKNE